MNNIDYISWDLETGGLKTDYSEAISVAGKAYNARTLEPYPVEQGGEFNSLMKPLYFDRLEPEAMRITKITKEQLEKAPDQKIVWNQFVNWVKKYNPKGTKWKAPIACGKNIRDFDMKFADRMNQAHCPKKEKTILFNTHKMIVLEELMFPWFENETEPEDLKMDTLRVYFGMSSENSHSALVDTRQTGELIMRFLRLHRELQKRMSKDGEKFIKFKGCCAGK